MKSPTVHLCLSLLVVLIAVATQQLHCHAFCQQPLVTRQQRRIVVPLAMSSEEPASASSSSSSSEEPPKPEVVCPNCDMCDGSGRIAGGIGAIFSFIPIKAYRPCPNFIERGGNYQRAGQGLDEIAFGKKNLDKFNN